jgi:hypothetical protein
MKVRHDGLPNEIRISQTRSVAWLVTAPILWLGESIVIVGAVVISKSVSANKAFSFARTRPTRRIKFESGVKSRFKFLTTLSQIEEF